MGAIVLAVGIGIGTGLGVANGIRRVTLKIRDLAKDHEIQAKDPNGNALTLDEFLERAQKQPPLTPTQKATVVLFALLVIAAVVAFVLTMTKHL